MSLRGSGFLVVAAAVFCAGSAGAGVGEIQGLMQVRRAAEVARFMGELHVAFSLSADSNFTKPETLAVGDYACTNFGQTLAGKRVVGALAKICFSPTAERIDEGAILCGGACSDRQEPTSLRATEVREIAERELRAALEREFPSRNLQRNPLGIVSKADVEEVWLQDETAAAVRGGFVVEFEAVEPRGRFVTYLDGTTGRLAAYENRIMNAAGQAEVYPIDARSTPDLVPVTLENLTTVEKLESSFFSVTTEKEDGPGASSPDGNYVFDPKDPRFGEVQLYYAMQVALQRLRSFGYYPFGSIPIVAHYGTDYSNAFYDGSMIAIGDGDGKTLLDLHKDNTVVTHEYGHAVIDHMAHVKMIAWFGDGPAFHEGHADYLACAVVNRPVVGAAVIPGGDPMRRCDTDWPFSKRKEESHIAGNVWSGAMWEVRNVVGAEKADVLAVDALLRLKPTGPLSTTKLEDGYAAVVEADKVRFGGRNRLKIEKIFRRRGYESESIHRIRWPWPKWLPRPKEKPVA